MTSGFDFEQALKSLQAGQSLTGKDGILTPLITLGLNLIKLPQVNQ